MRKTMKIWVRRTSGLVRKSKPQSSTYIAALSITSEVSYHCTRSETSNHLQDHIVINVIIVITVREGKSNVLDLSLDEILFKFRTRCGLPSFLPFFLPSSFLPFFLPSFFLPSFLPSHIQFILSFDHVYNPSYSWQRNVTHRKVFMMSL